MSVPIQKSLLSRDLQIKISKDLHIKEKSLYSYGGGAKKEIKMFVTDKGTVYLPYRYASDLFDLSHPNIKRPFNEVGSYIVKYPLRDYQEEIVEMSMKGFASGGTTVLNLFCSFGKTRMGVYFSALFSQESGFSTLVVVPPNEKVCEGWENTFRRHTTVSSIFVVGRSDGEILPTTQVIISMKNNLHRIPDEIMGGVGHLILDEADRLVSQKSFDQLLRTHPMYITCCTATYERSDGLHRAMDLIVGNDKIKKISSKPFYVVKISTPFVPENYKTTSRGIQWDSVQEEYDNMDERNLLILSLIMNNPKEKILVLTLHTKHARNLHSWLHEYGEKAALMCDSIKGYKDSRVLIGTFAKMGRGFDEETACQDWNGIRLRLLILAASTKQIEQFAGRVFRAESPVVFHLVDNFKNNKNHYSECARWYRERGGIIIERPYNELIVWENIEKEISEDP